ncbi:MAG: tRNA threonylcarbamoyladenosine dehydratase [Firmicutes bacterium]|nr:tRNA threonylcarbamoyladenosine dehydratase [Bacillota bacterium]
MNEPLYQRTQALLGEDAIEKLKNAKVLICGLGGVGGFTCEALARAGVGTLGLCDMDRVDPTNCNRQILALQSTIGKLKADVAEARVKNINPDVQLRKFALRIDEATIDSLDIPSWDYIADCIDDVDAKVLLIKKARESGVPILCSMGTGNKLDASAFRVTNIKKTEQDRLAKVMRKRLRDEGIDEGVTVVYSPEPPITDIKNGIIPSISFMPATAGLRMAGEIIQNLIK